MKFKSILVVLTVGIQFSVIAFAADLTSSTASKTIPATNTQDNRQATDNREAAYALAAQTLNAAAVPVGQTRFAVMPESASANYYSKLEIFADGTARIDFVGTFSIGGASLQGTYLGVFNPDTYQVTFEGSKAADTATHNVTINLDSNSTTKPVIKSMTQEIAMTNGDTHEKGRRFSSTGEVTLDWYVRDLVAEQNTLTSVNVYQYTTIQTASGPRKFATVVNSLSWEVGSGFTSAVRQKNFYEYEESNGSMLQKGTVSLRHQEITRPGQVKEVSDTSWYYLNIRETGKTTSYQVNSEVDLRNKVKKFSDYAIIDQYANYKLETYQFQQPYQPYYSIEYRRENLNEPLAPRLVLRDNQTKAYIVQGQPDVLSGETNDIFFVNRQVVNGYTVEYGKATTKDADGHSIFVGYGLKFFTTKSMYGFNIQDQLGGVIDYPTQNTITLAGITYTVSIDALGKVILTP